MFAWRDYLEVHPAADDYPLLKDSDPAAFRELVEDIRKHGLRANIVLWEDGGGKRWLLDGRNRLDALADLDVLYAIDGDVGLKTWTGAKWAQLSGDRIQFQHLAGGDPRALALSFNVHRRHLTPEERRARIEAAIKRNPEKSDRAIGAEVGHDHKTVGGVRREMEDVGSIPHVETRKDTKGRKQPAKKSKAITKPAPEQNDPEASAERMKQEYAADGADEWTDEDILPDHLESAFLIRADQARQFAVYSGEATPSLAAQARLVAQAWSDLATSMEARCIRRDKAMTTAAKQAEKPAPASDNDLGIPGFLRRTQ
jgi:hypothetical protein